MKKLAFLCVVAALTSCGPNPSTDSVTKTTTTVTTSSTPATPVTPDVPMPPAPLSPLTQANLDRIHDDMTAAEVQAILGAPTSSHSEPIPIVGGNQTTYNYDNGASSVTIVLKNNQVKEKSGSFGP